MAMFNDIVIFPGGKMARGKNYYRAPAQWQGKEMVDIGANTNCTPSDTKVSLKYIKIIFLFTEVLL